MVELRLNRVKKVNLIYWGLLMNMRKISLSLLIIAGLMNSVCCIAGEPIVTAQELCDISDLLYIKQMIVSPEYLAVEQAFEKKILCLRKIIDIGSLCNLQGNCSKSVELREAINAGDKAEINLNAALEQWELKTNIPRFC